MKQHRMRTLLASLVLLVLAGTAFAQDRVTFYKDKTRTETTYATGNIIAETPIKVTVKGDIRDRDIPPADVKEVAYDAMKDVPEFAQLRGLEARKDTEGLLKAYEAGLKKVPAAQAMLKRHVEFQIARCKFELAEAGTGDRQAAIAALRDFAKNHPDSRQIVEALELLSRALLAEGLPQQEVITHFRRLKQQYASAREIVSRSDLFEARALVKEAQGLVKSNPEEAKQKYADAAKRLQELVATADPGVALEMQLSLAECKAGQGNYAEALKDLDGILKGTPDDYTRAAVHLTRGDCYRLQAEAAQEGAKASLRRKAVWEYLWVDVVYNKVPDQQAKALFYLRELFTRLDDKARAKDCEERLLQKEFSASPYQKLVGSRTGTP